MLILLNMGRVAVIGAGYLGATHAGCMAELGHDVIAVDVDEAKLSKFRAGELPFFEPGLDDLLQRNVAAGRLRFTSSFQEAASFADVFFLAVCTPQQCDGQAADLSCLDAAIESLAPLLTKRAVIFGKCTVPVGTAARLAARVRELAPAGDLVELAWNPEFLREGFAVHDTLHPDRLVLGIDNDRPGLAEDVARDVYSRLLQEGIPLIVTGLTTAELGKCAANAFLATKISFINAMSEMCEHADADVTQLAEIIGYDPRIGRQFLQAGIGFGGGCLPKDLRAFIARAHEVGMDSALAMFRAVDDVNIRRRVYAAELARQLCDPLSGSTVAILGAAFKPNSDDVRDSPALDIAERIRGMGATVRVFDPEALENARRAHPLLRYGSSASDACDNADLVMVLTDWRQFCELRPEDLEPFVRKKVLIDGRNCLNPQVWRDAGWTYHGFGRT